MENWFKNGQIFSQIICHQERALGVPENAHIVISVCKWRNRCF